jgi:hypothetical protein
VVKLDYEKVYDKVNWMFLLDVLRKRGFGGKWLNWIRSILFRGSVGVIINNEEGEFFQTGKGLRQGDPLSPLLFNLVVDVLSRMLQKAANVELIRGLGVTWYQGVWSVCNTQMTQSSLWIVVRRRQRT